MIQNDKALGLDPEIMGPTRREEEKRKVDKVDLSTNMKEENLKLTTNEKKTDLGKKNCC